MKTVIQNVIGTIASAYKRSSSVAMRGASGCVDSRSCAGSKGSSCQAQDTVKQGNRRKRPFLTAKRRCTGVEPFKWTK